MIVLAFMVGGLTCLVIVLWGRVIELGNFCKVQFGGLRKLSEVTNERITAVEDRQDVQAEGIQACKDMLNL